MGVIVALPDPKIIVLIQCINEAEPIAGVQTTYIDRVSGLDGALNTIRDGCPILRVMFTLLKEERSLAFPAELILIAVAPGRREPE